jgi:hypothetical protein
MILDLPLKIRRQAAYVEAKQQNRIEVGKI